MLIDTDSLARNSPRFSYISKQSLGAKGILLVILLVGVSEE